jgi:hypothetical protein
MAWWGLPQNPATSLPKNCSLFTFCTKNILLVAMYYKHAPGTLCSGGPLGGKLPEINIAFSSCVSVCSFVYRT